MQGIEREFVGREAADTGMPGVDLNEQAGEPNQVSRSGSGTMSRSLVMQ
jgi:hypothetical protein